MGYWEAYRARMEYNDKFLRELAQDLEELGYDVRVSDSDSKRLISMIYIRKDGGEAVVGFAEVPYRWYINKQHNSSCCYYDLQNPFDVNEVVAKIRMQEIDSRFEFYKKKIA